MTWVPLLLLWKPILLSAVIVFVASSLIHMVLPWHKSDFPPMPNEDKVRAALRPLAIPPGEYMVPRPSTRADLKTPEFKQKVADGPVMVVTVLPNREMPMGKTLGQWFVFCVVVSLFAGYLTGRALPSGAPYLAVFRFAGTTAFIAYTVASWPQSIWFGRSWTITAKSAVDGLIYGCLTAGTFGWLWPR